MSAQRYDSYDGDADMIPTKEGDYVKYEDYAALRDALAKAKAALETVVQLPIARGYPDGPCLDKCDHDEVAATLAAIAATEKHP